MTGIFKEVPPEREWKIILASLILIYGGEKGELRIPSSRFVEIEGEIEREIDYGSDEIIFRLRNVKD